MNKNLWLFIFLSSLCFHSCQPDKTQKEEVSTLSTDVVKTKMGGDKAFSPQDPFVQKYIGTIGGKDPIEMLLTHWGDGFLTGYFCYTKNSEKIELQGEMNLNEMVELQAYLGDETIDKFVFPFSDLEKIEGDWSLPSKNKKEQFSLSALPAPTEEFWSGGWYLNGIWDGGQLMIGDVRDTTFYFALSVFRNSHIGEVEGEAKILGDSAVFRSNLDFGMGEEEEPCVIHFYHNGNNIEVNQLSSTLACGFGMRAYAAGQYDNRLQKVEPQLTFGDNAVFVSAQQHDDFKDWIGKNNYLEVAGNMQVVETRIYNSEKENIKGFLSEGVVLGLFTTNEAIILHDEKNAFWAATIVENPSSPGESVIRYFTNQKKWKDQMPSAFSNWSGSFSDYPVVFENN